MTIFAVYVPEDEKLDETDQFYADLLEHMNKINARNYIIVSGDLYKKALCEYPKWKN
jgi:hypothetical protein